ncbi:unnamed protein product, partial [Musa textilis]
MEPQRARVAHAPPRMRPRDALPRRPRRRLRPPPPGGEGRGEKPPGARGQLRGRRRGDVPDGDERDHEHAVGRDAGGPGGAECGGEGVPGAGGGDNGAAGAPNVSDFFPALARFDLQGIQRQMHILLERFDRIFESIIERRKRRLEEGGRKMHGGDDFLDRMLRLEAAGGDDRTPFTMTNVKALLMDMVVGGTETTSNTMEWTLAEMMQKPDVMKRAKEELDHVVGKDGIVEESHVSKLPYLGLVIKEVLRLHPALPLLVPHCPSSTRVVGGYTVPEGSRVFVNVWAIQRDPAMWKDPLEFRPERFADADRWDFSGNDFSYFPFGSGRRICAGVAMAERTVMYVAASLLHSFDWELPGGTTLELEEKFGIVMKKAARWLSFPRLDLQTLIS